MGFDFILIAPLLLSHCSFFSLDVGYLLAVDGCSTAGCNFGGLIGGDEHMSFYSDVLDGKTIGLFTVFVLLSFSECHTFGITQSVPFSA